MKIENISTILTSATPGRNWLFVKIETSDGLVGYGEASLESRELTTQAAVLELKRLLIGKDPTEIERIWQRIYRGTFWRGGPVLCSALSGVEQALWDILGKSLGAPVWKLLGGPSRDKVRAYTHVSGNTKEELAENAKSLVGKGFRALKLLTDGANNYDVTSISSKVSTMSRRPIKGSVARVAAVRNAVGDGVDLMLDAHGRLDPTAALALAHELEPYDLLFFEEPVSPDNISCLKRVSLGSKVPIAVGERLYTKFGFWNVVRSGSASVIQPDVCHAGGISECAKIASMAECCGMTLAPHNPNSPLSTAASIQLDSIASNVLIQEMIPDSSIPRSKVLKKPLEFSDGYLIPPQGPGLGVELDEEYIQSLSFKAQDIPALSYEDGSVADW